MPDFFRIGGNMVVLSQNISKVPGSAREIQLQSPEVKQSNINPYFLYEIQLMDVSALGMLRNV